MSYPLGRNLNHDPRSLQYKFDGSAVTLVSARWTRHVPSFDQGHVGSCTGNAAVGCVATSPYFETLPANTELDEAVAVSVYSDATKIDNAPGSYPPDDTGSNGLSVAKVLQSRGLISGYTHAFSLNDTLAALTLHPVIVGTNWYHSMFHPDVNGMLTIAPNDYVVGGHEYILDEIDVDRQVVGMQNSWGDSWGVKGRAYISFDTLGRLLSEQGDATVFVPVTQPAPVPTPVPPVPPTPVPPTPNPDSHLWDCVKFWATSPKYGKNKKVASALLEWAREKGYIQ